MLMFENINFELCARILSGEATPLEAAEHEKWLAGDPVNQNEWEEIVKTWDTASNSIRYKNVDADNAWNNVKKKINQQKDHKTEITLPKKMASLAAVALVLIISITIIWWLQPGKKITYQDITVQSIEGKEVILPDGSIVNLNSNTIITYTSPFKPDIREVSVDGEAFFQVFENKGTPFVIQTDDLKIKVLGTSFNVKSYNNQTESTVDVKTGIVEVSSKLLNVNSIIIESGLRVVYDRKKGTLEKASADRNFLAWKTKQIDFENSTLSSVFKTLENVYQVKIQVSDATILDEKMGGTFSHNSIEYITDVICTTFNLEYNTVDGNIIIYRKPK